MDLRDWRAQASLKWIGTKQGDFRGNRIEPRNSGRLGSSAKCRDSEHVELAISSIKYTPAPGRISLT